MRTQILATASAIALAGASPLHAQTANAGTGTAAAPHEATPAAGRSTAGVPAASTQTGTGMEQETPSTSGNQYSSQYNNPAMAGAPAGSADRGQMSQSGWSHGRWGHASRSEVRQVQERLQGDGLYRGRIDGIDGLETHQALRQYQQNNGLRVNGRLDRQTMASVLGGGNNFGSTTPRGGANGMNMPPASNEGAAGTGQTNAPATTH